MVSSRIRGKASTELTFIDASPAHGRDVAKQQLARTQGIRNAFRKRYQGQQDALTKSRQTQLTPKNAEGNNTLDQNGKKIDFHRLPRWSSCLAVCNIDPFETLPVASARLTTLLHHASSRQAGEPMFTLNDNSDCRLFYRIFDAGLQDAALVNALCLALKFAANEHALDKECMTYCDKAIQSVSNRMTDPAQAASSNTIGAVLLLAGVEGQTGNGAAAQAHLSGVKQIMRMCHERGLVLGHSLKRAAFWQDLNTSMIVGTHRIFDHETFPELHWHRDPYLDLASCVPPGFAALSDRLDNELLTVLADLSALQNQSKNMSNIQDDMAALLYLDNNQAWIESRLQRLLLQHEHDVLLRSCIRAAYLCAYFMFTGTWSATNIPRGVSTALVHDLETTCDSAEWDSCRDLQRWIIAVGACSAQSAEIVARYERVWLRSRTSAAVNGDRCMVHDLEDFMWLKERFEPKFQAFLDHLA